MHITGSSVSSIWPQSCIQQAIWIKLTAHLTWARNIYQDNKAFKLAAISEYEACYGTSISTGRCPHVSSSERSSPWGERHVRQHKWDSKAGKYDQWTEICLCLIRFIHLSKWGLPAKISQETNQMAVCHCSGIKAPTANPWFHLHWYLICDYLTVKIWSGSDKSTWPYFCHVRKKWYGT